MTGPWPPVDSAALTGVFYDVGGLALVALAITWLLVARPRRPK